MFTQSMHSSSAIAFPQPAGIGPLWCADNPNVDRSAPPPRKEKIAKRKPSAKKPAKKR